MMILWPLEGVTDADPLEGGYGFLDLTADGVTYHPGVDLNAGNGGDADCGAAVLCPAPGVVRYVGYWDGVTKGFGNHVWIEHDSGEWTHYCHLTTAPVPVGTRLSAGSVFATCGKSGGWPWCHTHFEVRHAQPLAWDYWPKAQPRAQVAADYLDPVAWLTSLSAVTEVPTVDPEDQRILDTVHALGGNADSIIGWIQQIGAEQSVIDQLKTQIEAGAGKKLTAVTLWYDDGSSQEATPAPSTT